MDGKHLYICITLSQVVKNDDVLLEYIKHLPNPLFLSNSSCMERFLVYIDITKHDQLSFLLFTRASHGILYSSNIVIRKIATMLK